MKKASALISLFLLAIVFISATLLNNALLDNFRVDLTEKKVYSLSPGSRAIIASLTEPVNVYFFFSEETSKGMTGLRNYANRVESLLQEYEKASDGKIRLHRVDPEPFSEAEDRAAAFGLTAANVGTLGEAVYFGIAGTNALDTQEVLPFLDPQKEQFLEYDISKLIYQLSNPQDVTVSIVSALPLAGGPNPMTGQFDNAMVIYEQLRQLFTVELVQPDAEALPDNTDVLVLMHPQGLSAEMQRAVARFAVTKGRILAFIDPHFESDPLQQMQGGQANPSSWPWLDAHGITVSSGVVLDPQLGLDVRDPQAGVIQHPGILGLGAEQLNRDTITTANLDALNGASFAAITQQAGSPLTMEVLATSSSNAVLIEADRYAQDPSPSSLAGAIKGNGEQFVLAARFDGLAKPVFSDASAQQSTPSEMTLIVVSDADLITNPYWVQQTPFFGDMLYTPFANNGDFIINAVESLAGSRALTSIRSRGTFSRPFTRVQELEVAAQARFREEEEKLQSALSEIDMQLAQLESQQADGAALALSNQQQAMIDEFIDKRLSLRQALRDVRYQLDKDIDALGNQLKLVNIVIAPLVMVFLLFLLRRVFSRRSGAFKRSLSQ
ncbi:GldG family protein [Alteromonas sp. CYL-A6]|uniref:GldG family protein n=1 Tax=Alteromonas nitratireducens TaxID=3390813 RepID=UPI0034C319C7